VGAIIIGEGDARERAYGPRCGRAGEESRCLCRELILIVVLVFARCVFVTVCCDES